MLQGGWHAIDSICLRTFGWEFRNQLEALPLATLGLHLWGQMASEFHGEVKAVRAMLQSMAGKPGVEAVKVAQANRLFGLVQKVSISVSDCPTLLAEVSQCDFSDADSGRLISAIAQRSGSGATQARPKLQDYTSLGHFFMQAQWDAMKNGLGVINCTSSSVMVQSWAFVIHPNLHGRWCRRSTCWFRTMRQLRMP